MIVAPLVGAWIEICQDFLNGWMKSVAPLVGAWIEIIYITYICRAGVSLLSWERGLKCENYVENDPDEVAPLVGAWIEIFNVLW